MTCIKRPACHPERSKGSCLRGDPLLRSGWRCLSFRAFHYLTEATRSGVIARSEATWQSTKPSQEGYGWQRSHKLRPLRETLDRHALATQALAQRVARDDNAV